MNIKPNQKGLTLMELLIAIALTGIIIGAFDQVAARILSTYPAVHSSQDLVSQARYALERMVTFVQESDQIQAPLADPTEVLAVSERLSDQYINTSRVYWVDGDTLPDADTNANGLMNEGGGDAAEFITFDLDKTDAGNWKLMEQMPDYSTSSTSDFKAKTILCEHVQAFTCTRLSAGIVEITLSLSQGMKAVTLRTAAKARWVD